MRFALLALFLLASGAAAAQTDAAAQRQQAIAELRAELARTSLSEDDQEFVLYCIVNDRTPGAECDPQRFLMVLFRLGADGERLQQIEIPDEAPERPRQRPDRDTTRFEAPTFERPRVDSALYADPGRFDPNNPPIARREVMAAPTDTRYAVAYGPGGGWAVASGGMDRVRVTGFGRPALLVSDDLDDFSRSLVEGTGNARALSLNHETAAALTTASGALEARGLIPVRVRDAELEARIDNFNRRRGNNGPPRSRETACEASHGVLSDAIEAAGNVDGQVVLQPGSCRWLLVAGGRAEEGPDGDPQSAESRAWADLQRAVQARLDAGERPAIGVTPETEQSMRSWVVITDTQIGLGPDLPVSFRETIDRSRTDAFSVTGRGDFVPVGSIHAIAFDPDRFDVDPGIRQGLTGWIAVGDGGFVAHGVASEVCAAAGEVTGSAGALNCMAPQASPSEALFTGPITMRQRRNKVAVLIHGITSPPQNAPGEHIGEMGHAGHYWGYDFVSGIVGSPYAPEAGHTLQMTTAQASGGLDVATVSREAWNACGKLAPARGACPVTDGLGSGARGDLAPLFTRSAPVWTDPSASPPGYGWTAAMISFRDGSRHLSEQLPAAIDQIYDTYQTHFGALSASQQPQLYLIGHSYGGVVSRALTTPMDPAETTPLAPNALTDEQQRRAAFLRDRIVLVGTLSTPHEGAPTPAYANTMTDMVRGLGDELQTRLANMPDDLFEPERPRGFPTGTIPDGADGGGSARPTRNQAVNGLTDGVEAVVKFISGYRDVFDDIDAQARANQTFLAPTRAVRSDGSPIPLYTMSGRLPGDRFFWKPRGLIENTGSETFDRNNYAFSRLDMLDAMLSGRAGKEAGALLAIELLIQRLQIGEEPGHPWGCTNDAAMDKTSVPRYSRPEPVSDLYTEGKRLAAHLLLYRSGYGLRLDTNADGDVDSDGFVSVTSGHGTSLNAPAWYRTHTGYGGWMPWDVDNHGSLMFNPGNGAWIHNHLLREAGPLAQPGLWSDWPNDAVSRSGERSITLTVDRIQALEDVDPLAGMEQADFLITLQVGDSILSWEAEDFKKDDDDDVVNPNISITHRTTSSVVPIRISLRDVDGEGFGGEDDELGVAPSSGREMMYAYVDLRTGQVFGDVYGGIGVGGANGPSLFATGKRGTNVPRARVTFRVSTAY